MKNKITEFELEENYEEKLNKAKELVKMAELVYNDLKLQCKHERKTWKAKYGGFYCEICETFLPRGKTENNNDTT